MTRGLLMFRWPFIVLATSVALFAVAAVQGGPALLHEVSMRTGLRLAGFGAFAAPSSALPARPFAQATSPAWSQTDQLVVQLQEQLKQKPDDPLAPTRYAQLGSLYLQKVRETGDPSYYTKAEAVLQKALQLAPMN